LEDVLIGGDVFIDISYAGVLSADMVKSMNNDSIIFAMLTVPDLMSDVQKQLKMLRKTGVVRVTSEETRHFNHKGENTWKRKK
jgi:malic enzyme